MKQNWVIDASPLIILGKAELLETISALATGWLIPNGVIQEISQKSAVEPLLAQLSKYAEVTCEKVPVIEPQVIRWNLDDGESEVITLAVKNAGYGVVLVQESGNPNTIFNQGNHKGLPLQYQWFL